MNEVALHDDHEDHGGDQHDHRHGAHAAPVDSELRRLRFLSMAKPAPLYTILTVAPVCFSHSGLLWYIIS
jgi:hypothetical protein